VVPDPMNGSSTVSPVWVRYRIHQSHSGSGVDAECWCGFVVFTKSRRFFGLTPPRAMAARIQRP
jgi:hypothetical protein